MNFTYELEQLEAGVRTPELIQAIIKKHEPRAEEMKKLYERYKTKSVPIFERPTSDPMEINNKINNDFFSEIIDTKVGYFSGNAVNYVIEGAVNKTLEEFNKRNRIADVDAETTKWAAICGYAARMVYIPAGQEGKPGVDVRVVNLFPWETILIGENGIDEADYAVRYYTADIADGKTELRAELYEAGKVTEFRGEGVANLKPYEEGSQDLSFDVCPVFGYMNNEELQGDAEKVLALIDGYDNALSDVNSEIEAFRSAYLAFYGVTAPDEEEEAQTTKSGTFYFGEGQNGEFITKEIQDGAVENHLNRLHKNIYRFSKTPDLGDENFGGTQTGPAMKYKIMSLENKCASYERKVRSSNIRMFEILASGWGKLTNSFDPYAVEMHFTRNFPEDTEAEARTQALLKGLVPEEFRFSKFPGVDNPKEMATAYKKEQDDIIAQFNKEESIVNEKLKAGEPTKKPGDQ